MGKENKDGNVLVKDIKPKSFKVDVTNCQNRFDILNEYTDKEMEEIKMNEEEDVDSMSSEFMEEIIMDASTSAINMGLNAICKDNKGNTQTVEGEAVIISNSGKC